MKIEQQAALVTGGASGLGAETARQLARAGAKVAILDVNLALAQTVAAEIGGIAIACDVSDAQSAEAAITEAREAHGPARLLVTCAGVAIAKRIVGRQGPMALADFARVININLIGTFNLMRLAADDMIKLDPLDDGERGVIITTASVAAYEGQIGQAAYASSKGGVVSLTMPAAREFSKFGVRVNSIAPGLFRTPLLANIPEKAQEQLAASIPFPKRLGHAKEYAKLALHIIDNVMLNGETIRLDGALRMAPR